MKKKFLVKEIVYTLLIILAISLPMYFIITDNPLKENEIIKAFSIGMITVYVLGILFVIIPLLKIYKELRQTVKGIGEDSKFEDIADSFRNTISLKKIFDEYKKTLRPIEVGLDEGENAGQVKKEYYATTDSEFFFNESSLIFKNISYIKH